MLDFLLGLYLAGLLVRGWLRGLVKEVLDLAGLVLGVIIAFRLSGPFGDFVSDRFDVTPEWARLGAGIALFLIVGIGLSVVAFWLGKVMKLPGLNLSNRMLGAGFAVAWGITILLVLVSITRALPLPSAVDETLDESVVVHAIASPGAPPQRLFQTLAGDDVLDTLLALEPLIGNRRLVLDEDDRAVIEPADPDELEISAGEARDSFDLVNRARIDAGVEPLAWSDGLSAVALGHALEMYEEGYVSHVSPETGTVGDRVQDAGIRLVVAGENLALAASARAVHAGFLDSDGHRENMLRPRFDRLGVAAVRGPLGLMVVQVYGG